MLELGDVCGFTIVLVRFRGGGYVAAYIRVCRRCIDHGCCESGEGDGRKLHIARLGLIYPRRERGLGDCETEMVIWSLTES